MFWSSSRHAFQAATPCLSNATCSSLAVEHSLKLPDMISQSGLPLCSNPERIVLLRKRVSGHGVTAPKGSERSALLACADEVGL
jgi:hypothetical protein